MLFLLDQDLLSLEILKYKAVFFDHLLDEAALGAGGKTTELEKRKGLTGINSIFQFLQLDLGVHRLLYFEHVLYGLIVRPLSFSLHVLNVEISKILMEVRLHAQLLTDVWQAHRHYSFLLLLSESIVEQGHPRILRGASDLLIPI